MSNARGVVKVCGVTTPADAEACVEAGVDWVGVNFLEGSPRRVSEPEALAVSRAVAGRALVVGLTRVGPPADLEALRRRAGLDLLQLYGEPTNLGRLEPCAFFAVQLGDEADVEKAKAAPGRLVLVDAKAKGLLGGTGKLLDVELARAVGSARSLMLAGGLGPENVAARIASLRPFGVDSASGVERAPGSKDAARVAAFVEAARSAFAALAAASSLGPEIE